MSLQDDIFRITSLSLISNPTKKLFLHKFIQKLLLLFSKLYNCFRQVQKERVRVGLYCLQTVPREFLIKMDTDKRMYHLFLIRVAKLKTSHVLQNNKNKTYRGHCDRLSVSISTVSEQPTSVALSTCYM